MTVRITLDGAESDVALARHRVGETLDAHGFVGDGDAVQLLVSELTTNALRGNPSPVTLVLQVTDEYAHISVECDDEVPIKAPDDGNEFHPARLRTRILDAFADGWGWSATPRRGKAVWFRVAGGT